VTGSAGHDIGETERQRQPPLSWILRWLAGRRPRSSRPFAFGGGPVFPVGDPRYALAAPSARAWHLPWRRKGMINGDIKRAPLFGGRLVGRYCFGGACALPAIKRSVPPDVQRSRAKRAPGPQPRQKNRDEANLAAPSRLALNQTFMVDAR
jgi:hypothetical protein